MSLRVAVGAVFRREMQLFARRKSDWANPLMFFLIVCRCFRLRWQRVGAA